MNAHGKSQFQPMLQLFEGYLDKKDVGDEARYDKVREGAIVFLGTLARHLDPSDAKVLPLRCSYNIVTSHTVIVFDDPASICTVAAIPDRLYADLKQRVVLQNFTIQQCDILETILLLANNLV